MKPQDISLKPEQESKDETQKSFLALRTGVGIFIHDATSRRLVEGASIQLDLIPLILDETSLTVESLAGLELIVADGVSAFRIQSMLSSHKEWEDGVNPALIAVVQRDTNLPDSLVQNVDALLVLPQDPRLSPPSSVLFCMHTGDWRNAIRQPWRNSI